MATTSSFEGKVCVVTGAASGIGAATARRLAQGGATVLLGDVDPRGEEVAAALRAEGSRAEHHAHDVSDEGAWRRLFARAVEAHGRVDVLVNNAGIAAFTPIAETTLEEWRRVTAINLDGVFLGTKHAVLAMRARGEGGAIVNVSSAMGLVGAPGASAYCATKGGVRLFTKAVALEVAADRIRVNSVHPGGVKTPIWSKQAFWPGLVAKVGEEGAYRAAAGPTPQARMADPAEIADAIAYLASDAAAFVTGAELVIDGGFTAM